MVCGHKQHAECHKRFDTQFVKSCRKKCGKTLNCGHKCWLYCRDHLAANRHVDCECECDYYSFTLKPNLETELILECCIPKKQFYFKIEPVGNGLRLISKCRKDSCYICENQLIHSDCTRDSHLFRSQFDATLKLDRCSTIFSNKLRFDPMSSSFLFIKYYKFMFDMQGWPVKVYTGLFSDHQFVSDKFKPAENHIQKYLNRHIKLLSKIRIVNKNLFSQIDYFPDNSKLSKIVNENWDFVVTIRS